MLIGSARALAIRAMQPNMNRQHNDMVTIAIIEPNFMLIEVMSWFFLLVLELLVLICCFIILLLVVDLYNDYDLEK